MLPPAQLGVMKLKSKFTFIDVEEQSPSLKRCASTPAMSTDPGNTAHCEDDYLAGLLDEARLSLPLAIPRRALGENSGDIAFTPTPALQSIEVACHQDSDVAGSLGHPYFCRRPCLFLALGTCRNGMACKYCHHAHDNDKPQSFSKRTRERMNRMKGSEKLRLLRDSLRQKVQKVPELASQVTGLVDVIEEGLCHEAQESSGSTGSRLHEKVAVMSVSAMLGDMFTLSIEPDIRRRLQEELQRLRIKACLDA
ncbi:unnamed protein product [Symbiodinium sp. CCMP2592]|nr:unnamed protein product [Symbiodinium sp. CCMP2592]